jgi:hypothetical protein
MPAVAVPDLSFSGTGAVNDAWVVQNLQAFIGSFSFTATNASPAVFTVTWPNGVNGNAVQLSGASLPTGFTQGTLYFVVNVGSGGSGTSTFNLALTPGGTGVGSTSTGSGTVTPINTDLQYV